MDNIHLAKEFVRILDIHDSDMTPDDVRVRVAVQIFEALADHFEEDKGTYRYLLYTRLGFNRKGMAFGALLSPWQRLWCAVNKDAKRLRKALEIMATNEHQPRHCAGCSHYTNHKCATEVESTCARYARVRKDVEWAINAALEAADEEA